jgi:hypothetical protein
MQLSVYEADHVSVETKVFIMSKWRCSVADTLPACDLSLSISQEGYAGTKLPSRTRFYHELRSSHSCLIFTSLHVSHPVLSDASHRWQRHYQRRPAFVRAGVRRPGPRQGSWRGSEPCLMRRTNKIIVCNHLFKRRYLGPSSMDVTVHMWSIMFESGTNLSVGYCIRTMPG